jgi:prepilin-type N-terminal cleavage/methylation domain-containing protein
MATLRNLRQNARGFTLTEIMVTLVIFSIVMAVSFPMLAESNRNHQLLSAAARIEAALMRARSTAVTQQTPVRVSFNPDTNTLVLAQDTNRDGNFDTQMRTINIDGNIAFANITLDGGNAVTFDQRGAPDNPGTIVLGNGGDAGQRVLISAGSGAVSVSAVPMAHETEPAY